MNFYHILFGLKHGFNRNLTWYENLFVKFYNNTIAKLAAKILRIKGNTVSFNQLIDPNDFGVVVQAGYTWTTTNGSINITGTSNSTGIYRFSNLSKLITGHKYFMKGCPANGSSSTWYLRLTGQNIYDYGSGAIFQFTELPSSSEFIRAYVNSSSEPINITFTPQFHDLTLMGIDNFTTTTEVEAWLSSHVGDMPYYDYTTGTLIPFMGSGLKTTGKNLLNPDDVQVAMSDDGYYSATAVSVTEALIAMFTLEAGTYSWIANCENEISGIQARVKNADGSAYIAASNNICAFTLAETQTIRLAIRVPAMTFTIRPILLMGNNHSTPITYEPYTSNTLSLPISTYFPSGMKSAGSVYDEMTRVKATTRIGREYLASIGTWVKNIRNLSDTGNVFYVLQPSIGKPDKYITANYTKGNVSQGWGKLELNQISFAGKLDSYWYLLICTADSDVSSLIDTLNGQELYYELATPIETDISLDLTYPIQWGGTEQILPVNTSTPTTSGIVADIKYPDGIRYDQTFVYRVIEKATQLGNRALSIMFGKKVETDNPEEPLDILLKGEK